MGVKEGIDEDTSNGVKSIWRCFEVHIKFLNGISDLLFELMQLHNPYPALNSVRYVEEFMIENISH